MAQTPTKKPAQASVTDGKLPFQGCINLPDALDSYAVMRGLQEALDLPTAVSFKRVSPPDVAIGTQLDESDKLVYGVDDLEEITSLASASGPWCVDPLLSIWSPGIDHANVGAARMPSFGDFIALSAGCGLAAAGVVLRGVSGGVVAPSYINETVDVLRKEEGANRPIIYPTHNRDKASWRSSSTNRNNARIDASLFANVVTKNKRVGTGPVVGTLSLKYAWSNNVTYTFNSALIGIGAEQQSHIHCTRLGGTKRVGCAEKANAVGLFVSGEVLEGGEKAYWEGPFKRTMNRPGTTSQRLFNDILRVFLSDRQLEPAKLAD
ncbi:cytidine deaminase-like protein [Infundibulicybe gibba]|nr:cytidine deaminase-like protein [Infundibulicybe gibba]